MRYALGRIGYSVSLFLATTIIAFILFQLIPTDPARTALGANASEAQVAALSVQLGLNLPATERLSEYFQGILVGDLGQSFVDGRSVASEVVHRFALTASLTTLATLITALYLYMQLEQSQLQRWRSTFGVINAVITAAPTMFISAIVIWLIIPFYPYNYYPGNILTIAAWAFLLPPALTLALYPMGILGKIAANEHQLLASSGFVLAARARGIDEQRILWKYIVPNSLIPLLGAYATLLPLLLTGSFIVEIMFSVPGMGALLLKSVLNRDLPMLQGIVIVGTAFLLLLNLVVEVLYPLIDPRIRDARDG